jgi:hypothetical protein
MVTPALDPRRPRKPEIAFVRAILFGAIADLHDMRPNAAGVRHLAREWINGSGAPVTFATCCAALHLDPAAVREALLDAAAPDAAA